MALTGPAVIRKRLRQRFGITAQRVSIRSETPWYWRALLIVTVLASSMALATWLYDAANRYVGIDQAATDRQIAALQSQIRALETEIAPMRAVVHASDSRLQVETTTQDRLSAQIRALQRENSALKEEVALFENLVAGSNPVSGPRIARVSVEPKDGNGYWRYRVVIVNSTVTKGARDASGQLQFEFSARQDGKDVSIVVPPAGTSTAAYQFTAKNFQRLEGEFSVPPGTVLKGGEARVVQDGATKARAKINL